MAELTLTEGFFLHPTPGGVYNAISGTEENASRVLLRNLLGQEETPPLTLDVLVKLSASENEEGALTLLKHMQSLAWVEGVSSPCSVESSPLEEALPKLLGRLSSSGKALLGDEQGFYLAASGFPHEVAEELSALSAELASLHARRSGLLVNNLGLGSSAWSIVGAAGHSQIGFWPLFIGKQRFVLIMEGVPYLNRPEFVELIWMLSNRYASSVIDL
jgi:hypothetical protein